MGSDYVPVVVEQSKDDRIAVELSRHFWGSVIFFLREQCKHLGSTGSEYCYDLSECIESDIREFDEERERSANSCECGEHLSSGKCYCIKEPAV